MAGLTFARICIIMDHLNKAVTGLSHARRERERDRKAIVRDKWIVARRVEHSAARGTRSSTFAHCWPWRKICVMAVIIINISPR